MTCPPTSLSFGAVLPCSSTTRPTGFDLYPGRVIYEVDTFRTLEWDGTGWIILAEPWQTVASPTTSGFSVGNGSLALQYHRSDGMCDFKFHYTQGTTSNITGNAIITLPIAALNTEDIEHLLGLVFTGAYIPAPCYAASASTVQIATSVVSGANVVKQVVDSTHPGTWNTQANWQIILNGRYRMITRYS